MNSMTNRTVGDLVAERPSLSRIFERRGIDYCCGGRRTLEQAALEAKTDVEDLLLELGAQPAIPSDRDWRDATIREVVEHILQAHHQWLHDNMDRISDLARKVARVHGDHAPVVREVESLYLELRADLEPHLAKEERILFPAALGWSESGSLGMGCGSMSSLEGPVSVMEADHAAVGRMLDRLVVLTDGFRPPPEACGTWRALWDALQELDANTRAHVHLENEVLHPAIRALAGPE